MKKIISFIFFLSILSCSFKRPEDSKNLKSQSELQANALQDSDGDGVTDHEEIKASTNPLLADIPVFEGEYFEEMKITTHLHNTKTNKFESVSFQVRKNETRENGTPVEERDFLSKGSQFLIEQNGLLARKASFKGSHYVGNYNSEDIGHYAPPRMNDLKIFPYSERINELSKTHEFEEMEFQISNRLKFGFLGGETYTDLVFDLYWYNSTKNEFSLIGTDFLSGVYQFNSNYSVPLKFKTSNKELVRHLSVTGGRFIYLKLRDFKIIELGKFYNQILTSVKEKSIPLIYFDGEKECIQYVGVNGKPTTLKAILDIGLPEKAQIYHSKIVGIGKKTEKTELTRDPYGEGKTSEYRFQLLTNEIANNPFSYAFTPGDILIISYVSTSDLFPMVPTYFGAKLSSNEISELKTIKILTTNLVDLRINLRPEVVKYKKTRSQIRIPLQLGMNSPLSWSYQSEEIMMKGVQALALAAIIKVKINGVEFFLDELINSKDALFRIKNSEIIEIKFKESILTKIPESTGLTITFSSSKRMILNCDGQKTCESNSGTCEKFLNNPPRCEDFGEYEGYSIIDNTRKTNSQISGSGFLSIEYL